jgi:hypothetical protein
VRIITEEGYINAVALFFELDDVQLQKIKNDREYYKDSIFLDLCYSAKGNNAHFYHLCKNEDSSIIKKHIKLLLKDYATVSWWDKGMKEFKITRR